MSKRFNYFHEISQFQFNVVVLKPRIILLFTACVADTAVDNLNGIRTLLPDVLITLFINGKQTVINGSGSLPRNPPFFFIDLY